MIAPNLSVSISFSLRTLVAEELARNVHILAADDDNLLAAERLLGNNGCKATQQMALAINDNNLQQRFHRTCLSDTLFARFSKVFIVRAAPFQKWTCRVKKKRAFILLAPTQNKSSATGKATASKVLCLKNWHPIFKILDTSVS